MYIHNRNIDINIKNIFLTLILFTCMWILYFLAHFGELYTSHTYNSIRNYFAMSPDNYTYIELISNQFVHGNIYHISTNMLGLLVLGSLIERKIKKYEFILFFILSSFIASFIQIQTLVFLTDNLNRHILGSSGYVYSLIGLFAFIYPYIHIKGYKIYTFTIVLPFIIISFGRLYIAGVGTSTAHVMHVSGLLFGVLYGFIRWYFIDRRN